MPHLHDRFNDPLRLAIGPWGLDPGEPLFDVVRLTQPHKGMMFRISPIFFPVVGVELFDRVGAFLQNLLQECFRRVLGLVRKDSRIQGSDKICLALQKEPDHRNCRFMFPYLRTGPAPLSHFIFAVSCISVSVPDRQ